MLNIRDHLIGSLRIAVHDSGPQSCAEAVVFVHGNPGPMDDYAPIIDRLGAGARTVACDLPGYGRSEHPSQFDFSVAGYAHFLEQLLTALGVRRAHLVLHDFGGPFGLQWAINHPQSVASLTLINTGVLPGYRWHKFARVWQTPVLGELFQLLGNRRVLEGALNKDNPRPFPREFVDRIDSFADWGHKQAVLRLYRASRDLSQFEPFIPQLRMLDLPTCVVWGAQDRYLPVALAERQKEAFPRANVHVLPGLGHWPMVDEPQQVCDLAVPFIQRQLTGHRDSQ